MNKVIFAEEAATVHILTGEPVDYPDGTKFEPHESRVLIPGETLSLSEVPSYLRDLVEKGEAPGLTLLTPTQAKKLNERAKTVRNQFVIIDDNDEDEVEEIEEVEETVTKKK